MESISDESEDSLSVSVDSTSSDDLPLPNYNHFRRCDDCICGGDHSDSDWIDVDYKESKKAKVEIVKNVSRHKQLHRALKLHDCRMIRKLLDDGVQPCTKFKSNRSCFVLACRSKFILKKFLEIEPSGVNCQNSEGSTMLMLVTVKFRHVFNLLCKYRPDMNMQNDDGNNILHMAVIKYHSASIFERILELGIDIHAVNCAGETALTLAIKEGKKANIVDMLLDGGATLPPPDEDGKTIVMRAIEAPNEIFRDKVDVLKVLFKHGADVSAKDNEGHNAMYYVISACIPQESQLPYGIRSLEEIIILLLEHHCEIQDLDHLYQRIETFQTSDGLILNVPIISDVISTIVISTMSIELIKVLLNRGQYSWINPNPNVISPLSACLVQLLTSRVTVSCPKFLKVAKELILLGADVSQRIWFEVCCPDYIAPLQYYHSNRTEYQTAVARELEIPDALFFAVNMRILLHYSTFTRGHEDHGTTEINAALEDMLRSLLRFWPHPPLLLMLLLVNPTWCSFTATDIWISNAYHTDMFFMMQFLAKIGGSLPLGTRYYTILKSALQRMADRNDLCKPMLTMLLKLDGGIPTLRSLSHAAFRATVKKTCPTGLDFSEYRVLCQGEMVPIPPDIVNFLNFKV